MSAKLYKIIITPDAEIDLDEIKDYITYELAGPEVATKYVSQIKGAIFDLRNMPMKNELVPFEPWRTFGMHWIHVKRYNVYFYIVEEISSVFIANVIFQGRDQERALNRN